MNNLNLTNDHSDDYTSENYRNDESEIYYPDIDSSSDYIIDSADDMDGSEQTGFNFQVNSSPAYSDLPDGMVSSDEEYDSDYYDGTLDDFFDSESGTDSDERYSEPVRPARSAPRTKHSVPRKRRKKSHPVRNAVLHGILVFCAVISAFYLVAVYSNNAFITKYRNMYIQTAMATINHKYLATAIIPSDIINNLLRMQYESEINAIGVQSDWGSVEVQALPSFNSNNSTDNQTEAENTGEAVATTDQTVEQINDGDDSGTGREYSSEDEKTFFELFYEIDYDSFQNYLSDHPETLDNGWANININEAGLDDEGTSIQTIHGDQVLAINASEGITLIRIYINSSRGIMAICKDTSKLSLCPASTLGSTGQTIGKICDANDGILSLTGSAFMDDGNSNGGQISGLAVCSGTQYGARLGGTDKRIELRNDNKMYIVDSVSAVDADTRDACEFRPALIVDGQIIVDDTCGWTSPNPRAVLGQSERLETMMVVLEGRLSDSPGDSVVYIAEKLLEYGCAQALNLDGGTSALMYYDGEYVSRCSNTALPSGRTLPTAWVYRR